MSLVDLSKILSAIFAGASVLFAVYVFRRNNEREYFSSKREALVQYRLLVEESSELFDEIGLVEIGHSVAAQLRAICPAELNAKEVQDFFYDEENTNFIRQAIFLGLGESKTLQKAKDTAIEISQLAGKFGEPFPVLRVCLGVMSAYNNAIVNTVSSGHLINEIFEEVRKNRQPEEVHSEEELFHPDLIFRQMAVYVTLFHDDFINNYALEMLGNISSITEILTKEYESKSDRGLRKRSKLEKSNIEPLMEKGRGVRDSKNALFEYLKFYKALIPHEEWDRVVEAKTLLEAASPSSLDEEES